MRGGRGRVGDSKGEREGEGGERGRRNNRDPGMCSC